MISMIFCALLMYIFYRMMGLVLKASWGIIKVGTYILAIPILIGAFVITGIAVMLIIMFMLAGIVCLLGLF